MKGFLRRHCSKIKGVFSVDLALNGGDGLAGQDDA